MKNIIGRALVLTMLSVFLFACSKDQGTPEASLDGLWYLDVEATLAPKPDFPRDIMEYFWTMHGTSLEIDLKRGTGEINFSQAGPRDFGLLVMSATEAKLTRPLIDDPFSPDEEQRIILSNGILRMESRHYLEMVFVREKPAEVSRSSLSGEWRLDGEKSRDFFQQAADTEQGDELGDIPLRIDVEGGTMNFAGGDAGLNVPIALAPERGKVFNGLVLEPGLGRSAREFMLVARSDGSLLFVHNDLRGVFVRAE